MHWQPMPQNLAFKQHSKVCISCKSVVCRQISVISVESPFGNIAFATAHSVGKRLSKQQNRYYVRGLQILANHMPTVDLVSEPFAHVKIAACDVLHFCMTDVFLSIAPYTDAYSTEFCIY